MAVAVLALLLWRIVEQLSEVIVVVLPRESFTWLCKVPLKTSTLDPMLAIRVLGPTLKGMSDVL